MFYVYLLRSLKDNKYYIGQTEDVSKRLECHNAGKVLSTRSRRPLILVGYKEFNTRDDARWFEYSVKKHGDKKQEFIKGLASGS